MSSLRPVYVPKRKRQQQQGGGQGGRWHGAFQGGFSAGYYNTVGTKEGWEPTVLSTHTQSNDESNKDDDNIDSYQKIHHPTEQQQQQQQQQQPSQQHTHHQYPQQRLEDFMDEQDHNEWGGPVRVKADYQPKTSTTTTTTSNQCASATASNSTDRAIDDLFAINNNLATATTSTTTKPFQYNTTIRYQLLQQLGWRDTGDATTFTAYIPVHTNTDNTTTTTTKDQLLLQTDQSHSNSNSNSHSWKHDSIQTTNHTTTTGTATTTRIQLSDKVWHKIVRQQKHIAIPQSHLGTMGLGYQSLINAPEFEHARQKRKIAAQQRTHKAIIAQQGAYRVSTILPLQVEPSNEDRTVTITTTTTNNYWSNDQNRPLEASSSVQNNLEAVETIQDFVGTKSTAGFALQDDEDDAYDDNDNTTGTVSQIGMSLNAVLKSQSGERSSMHKQQPTIDHQEYNTIVYENSDSSDDNYDTKYNQKHNNKNTQAKNVSKFGAALSSFVLGHNKLDSTKQQFSPTAAVTNTASKITNILPGFVLGGSGSVHQPHYYRGPDIPTDWIIERHVFTETEYPAIVTTLARAEQLNQTEERHAIALQQALAQARVKPTLTVTETTPATMNATSATQIQTKYPNHCVFANVGQAIKNRFTTARETDDIGSTTVATQSASTTIAATNPWSFVRTVQIFAPHTLLCKRFDVAVPASTQTTLTVASTPIDFRTRDEIYFQDEILSQVAPIQKDKATKQHLTPAQILLQELAKESTDADTPCPETTLTTALAICKSIFDPVTVDTPNDPNHPVLSSSSVLPSTLCGNNIQNHVEASCNNSRNSSKTERWNNPDESALELYKDDKMSNNSNPIPSQLANMKEPNHQRNDDDNLMEEQQQQYLEMDRTRKKHRSNSNSSKHRHERKKKKKKHSSTKKRKRSDEL